MAITRIRAVDDPDGWDMVVRDQRRVVTAAQANAAFGKPFVLNQIRSHRWQRPCRGVIVLHNSPILDSERTMIALLSCPPGSVVGGLSALREDGFTGFESLDSTPRIILPAGARRPGNRDIVAHWSHELGPDDVHPLRMPPRTRTTRSTISEANWSRHPRLAKSLILSAVQQRLCRPEDILAQVTKWPNGQHHALIIESALDAAGGSQSLPEHDFVRLCNRYGAPSPSQQSLRTRPPMGDAISISSGSSSASVSRYMASPTCAS